MPFNIPNPPQSSGIPAIEVSFKVGPIPKKRGRKRSKKQYFTKYTDLAIKEYLNYTNQA